MARLIGRLDHPAALIGQIQVSVEGAQRLVGDLQGAGREGSGCIVGNSDGAVSVCVCVFC